MSATCELCRNMIKHIHPMSGKWYVWRTPFGRDHLVQPGGVCFTCGSDRHPDYNSSQFNCDWVAGTLWLKDPEYARALNAAGGWVAARMENRADAGTVRQVR